MNEVVTDAFRHSAWATRVLIDACRTLTAEQLTRPGRAFGSVLATFDHVVSSDADYAAQLGAKLPEWARRGNASADLDQIAARAAETASLWEQVLRSPVDAERLLLLDSGTYEVHAGVVVAQALHHANVHREQIRASLKEMGVPRPDLQPWAYADASGRSRWLRAEK